MTELHDSNCRRSKIIKLKGKGLLVVFWLEEGKVTFWLMTLYIRLVRQSHRTFHY